MDPASTPPHFLTLIPFALLLLAMALGPIFFPNWWHKHYPKVAISLGAIVVIYYLLALKSTGTVLHAAEEYVSFIALIGSLYVVSGGIHIRVKGEGTPLENTIFLAVGAVLANILGTTGASMLLIRPWIRVNRHRVAAHHIAFFIFTVSNVGGCLTPIGDPPLFLGYLAGVPFWWVATHGWHIWLVAIGLILAIFFAVDSRAFARAPERVHEQPEPEHWHFSGLPNLAFLAVIFGSVFLEHPKFLREFLMIAAAVGSWFTTRKSIHKANEFNWFPVKEVAILFIGIFGTMMPALAWLSFHAAEISHPSPAIFYFGSGILSAVLDNAPTYLGFLSVLYGAEGTSDISQIISQFHHELLAISIGCVFFGAATYIGNGPNFMVKSIADHQRVPTPTLVGFVGRFTLPYLLPVLIVVWLLFFRG